VESSIPSEVCKEKSSPLPTFVGVDLHLHCPLLGTIIVTRAKLKPLIVKIRNSGTYLS